MNTQTMQQECQDTLATGDKPMPKYIRRSVYPLSIDDAQLGDKAYASHADAIILDVDRKSGCDWQADELTMRYEQQSSCQQRVFPCGSGEKMDYPKVAPLMTAMMRP